MDLRFFTKIYLGAPYLYTFRCRGWVNPLYFCPDFDEEKFFPQIYRTFLEILEEESPIKIKDFDVYSPNLEYYTEFTGISIDVRGIKNKFEEGLKLFKKQIPREGSVDLLDASDIYSFLANPYIWQRERFMLSIHRLLRNVIERGKSSWDIGEDEETEFNQANLDFEQVERICYELIKAGCVKDGIYILEAMREKITNPLLKGMIFYYHDQDEAVRIFNRYKEEIKQRISRWFK